MNTCALASAANDDACLAPDAGARPLAKPRPRRSCPNRHRQRAIPGKTLDTMVGGHSFIFPGSWRPFLRNSEVPSPVYNVFPSNVFVQCRSTSMRSQIMPEHPARVLPSMSCRPGSRLGRRCATDSDGSVTALLAPAERWTRGGMPHPDRSRFIALYGAQKFAKSKLPPATRSVGRPP